MTTLLGIQLYRPRLLLALLLGMMLVIAATAALAGTEADVVPIAIDSAAPVRSDPSPEDLNLARILLETTLAPAAQGPLTPTFTDARVWTQGSQRRLHVIVTIPSPLTRSGPWSALVCRGARILRFSQQATSTRFSLVVDLQRKDVVELGPSDPQWDPEAIGPFVLEDSATRQPLKEYANGRLLAADRPAACPPGTADD